MLGHNIPRRATLAGFRRAACLASFSLLFAVGGCSDDGAEGGAGTGAATPPTGAGSATPTPDPVTTEPATPPPDPVVTAVPTVTRAGLEATPTASAPVGSLQEPLTYSDGVTLDVTSIEQGVNTQRGPGEMVGVPHTTFHLTLHNGAATELNVGSSVVTLTYGSPARLATPVYDETARDFAGAVPAGASSDAVYRFAVPVDQVSQVTLTVDFGNRHLAATFQGSAT